MSQQKEELRPAVAPAVRHQRYYFPDGSAIFLVESTLFNVHRSWLCANLPVFADMFSLPQLSESAPAVPEGLTDKNPIVLEGVTSDEFVLLLSILYPSDLLSADGDGTSSEWLSILSLAVKYNATSIQDRALRKLSSILTPAEKIGLAHIYDIAEAWLEPAYIDLSLCETRLGLRDAKHLTPTDFAIICHGRESVAARRGRFAVAKDYHLPVDANEKDTLLTEARKAVKRIREEIPSSSG